MYLNYGIQLQNYLLSYINIKFIKLIMIMIQAQNWNLIVVLNQDLKFLSARFQLENQNAPARLESTRNPLGSAHLEKFQLERITSM